MQALAVRYVSARRAEGAWTGDTPRRHSYVLDFFCREVKRLHDVDRPDEVTRHHVVEHLDLKLRPQTRRVKLSVIRCFASWLLAEGHIVEDFTHGIPSPKIPRESLKAWTGDEVAAVLNNVESTRAGLRDRAMILLMVHSGLRRIELHRLDVEHLSLTERSMFVRGKGGHERVTPVPDEAYDALIEMLAGWRYSTGPLFRSSTTGERLCRSTITKIVWRRARAAGIKQLPQDGRSAHGLRRTCGRDVYERCRDLNAVASLLGHANVATAQIYTGSARLEIAREAACGRSYRTRVRRR